MATSYTQFCFINTYKSIHKSQLRIIIIKIETVKKNKKLRFEGLKSRILAGFLEGFGKQGRQVIVMIVIIIHLHTSLMPFLFIYQIFITI